MVALVRPSNSVRTGMPPRYAAFLQEREQELDLLAHMLANASGYREAEMLGLTPADFIHSSQAGSALIQERNEFGSEVERTVGLVADHAILAHAIALSRTERMNVYEAIEEICQLKLAQTRNPIDQQRLEVQRQSVPALVDKARGQRTLSADEFQRKVRSLKRLRAAMAEAGEPKTRVEVMTEPRRAVSGGDHKPNSARKAAKPGQPVGVTPLRRSEVVREASRPETDNQDEGPNDVSHNSAPEFDASQPEDSVTITTTIYSASEPDRRSLFQRTVVGNSNGESFDSGNTAIDSSLIPLPGVAAHGRPSRQVQSPGFVPNKYGSRSPSEPARMATGPELPLAMVEPLSNTAESLAEQIFSPKAISIPTPAAALNEAFSGGWSRNKLYILAAPPENGKTTFCAWAADYAAQQKIPVLFVSFELSKSQLWLHGIARVGRLDSRGIENQRWLTSELGERMRRQVQSSIDNYGQLARYLNVVEAPTGITPTDLRPAIDRVRAHYQLNADAPILVIIDSLAGLGTGIPEVDFNRDTDLKGRQTIISLKQLARETGTAVLAVAPTSAAISSLMAETGEANPELLRKETWHHSAADAIMLLASNEVSGSDQLQLLINRYRDNDAVLKRLRRVREDSPSDPAGLERSTYSRLSVLKNRGGARSELIFLYQRAFHNFVPFDLLLEISRPS